MMGIAEFIIGRAFARPVGSTHPTKWPAGCGIRSPPIGIIIHYYSCHPRHLRIMVQAAWA